MEVHVCGRVNLLRDSSMIYRITDLIEPDNGCEGFMPGEEPLVTLILEAEDGTGKTVQLPDMLAYKLRWDTGVTVSDEELAKYCLIR